MMLQWMIEADLRRAHALAPLQQCGPLPADAKDRPAWWRATLGVIIEQDVDLAVNHVGDKALEALPSDCSESAVSGGVPVAHALEGVAWMTDEFRKRLWTLMQPLVDRDLSARRRFILLDLAATCLVGIIRDGVVENGLEAIDGYELREFLLRHGARDFSAWSPPVKAWYDSVAAYLHGEADRPVMSAAVGVQSLFRLFFAYEGSFAYQMSRARIGDTLIAPWYQVLHDRGVVFRYFHRVWDVVPSDDGRTIDRITVERQVELEGGPDAYRPFIEVNGHPCWPNHPLWDQIVGGDPGGPRSTRSIAWRAARWSSSRAGATAPTTSTSSFWRCRSNACPSTARRSSPRSDRGARWSTRSPRSRPRPCACGGGPIARARLAVGLRRCCRATSIPSRPGRTSAHLLATEVWPGGEAPKHIDTVFGPLPAPAVPPPPEDLDYPERQARAARENGRFFLENHVGALWPEATAVDNPVGVDWSKLADYEHREGKERFAFQYTRANVGPVERYTLTPPGTLSVRLRTDQSGYENLFLAGEWTRNHFEIGSFEGATMAGFLASRAISGHPHEIIGVPAWGGIRKKRS